MRGREHARRTASETLRDPSHLDRTTEEERALIDRAVAVSGADLTEFVVAHVSEAARRVLADLQSFELDAAALAAWEELSARTTRDFYIHLVPEFEQSPTDMLHLVLLAKEIRRTL